MTTLTLDLANQYTLSDRGSAKVNEGPVRQWNKTARQDVEVWSLQTRLSNAVTVQGIVDTHNTVGDCGVVGWVPPGEGAARSFRFVPRTFRVTEFSSHDFRIRFSLVALPGVIVPT